MPARFLLPLLCAFSLPVLADAGHYSFGHPAKAASAKRSVEITLGDIYFKPASVQVKAGETVRFVLHNEGKLVHEFSLGDAAMHAEHQKQMLAMQHDMGGMDHSQMGHDMTGMDHGAMQHADANTVTLEPGQSAELTWTFTQATGLQFACNIPGHYQAGMVGTLDIQ